MFSKLLLPALALGGLSLLIALAEAHGYSRAEKNQAEQQNKALQEALAARDALQTQIDNLSKDNADLLAQVRNQPLETPKYETDQLRDTRLLLGAVSLLNVQRGYPVGSPENPRLAAGKDGQPSTVTCGRIQAESEQCEKDYRIAVTRLNGLIDSCLLAAKY